MWSVDNVKDLAGKKFGSLVVIEQNGRSKGGSVMWLCDCDCGVRKTVRGSHLIRGSITSCGCNRRLSVALAATKHGHASGRQPSSTYNSWVRMIDRCTNEHNNRFPRYGGRGIKVCERWKKFENFLADLGEKPDKALSIDRINNDGDYEPGNCRWATASEQARNRSVVMKPRAKKNGGGWEVEEF